jgi:hypothetical protein
VQLTDPAAAALEVFQTDNGLLSDSNAARMMSP